MPLTGMASAAAPAAHAGGPRHR